MPRTTFTDRVSRDRQRRPLSARIAHFKRDEEGSLIIFSLFIFTMMLIIGGMAIDLMRFETRRSAMQNTIDSAVLAAADLDQTLDAELVVRSYFEESGFDKDAVVIRDNPSYVSGTELVGREVRATTPLRLNTFFMHMLGIEELAATSTGSAIENIQNVEISLVLDISGSMRFPASGNSTPSSADAKNRINDLKGAVKEFVHQVLQVTCDADGTNCIQSPNTASTTINIIPYAGHVNPGPELFGILGGNRWHNWSSCKEVTDADFDNADLPRASGDQLPHFMKWAISDPRFWMNWGWCPKDEAAILIMENDFKEITDFIDDIRLHDGTATHVGMKYGVALLNPSSRDEIAQLAGLGVVDSKFNQRPANWEDDVVKYVVLMTDGKTTSQFRPKWTDADGNTQNWTYDLINTAFAEQFAYVDDGSGTPPPEPTIDPDLGAMLDTFGTFDGDLDMNAAEDVEQGYPSTSTYSESGKSHNESRNNGHITAMCNEAKKPVYLTDGDGNVLNDTNGLPLVAKQDRITVFTIAFLAPSNAQTLMKNCASSESHYFKVEDLKIDVAFEAIAKTINQLRLSQ